MRDYKIDRLPVNILSIAKNTGIKVIKNSLVNELQPHESGLSYFDGEQWYILYDYIKSVKGNKSSKMKKAEKMCLDGLDIKIISENTFLEMLENK